MLTSRVQKWGSGQGLRLSKQVLELADLAVGDDVEIMVGDQQILIMKVRQSRYDLAELVSRIPKGHKAGVVDFGRPLGKEEW